MNLFQFNFHLTSNPAPHMQGLGSMHVLDWMKKEKTRNKAVKTNTKYSTTVALGNSGRSDFGTKRKLIHTLHWILSQGLSKYCVGCNIQLL